MFLVDGCPENSAPPIRHRALSTNPCLWVIINCHIYRAQIAGLISRTFPAICPHEQEELTVAAACPA
ncbi:unnamed protein product, partial [Nesidiocoris tenuis]